MNFSTLRNQMRQSMRRFANDDGSVTVEFVLWVPVFVLILAITVDATILFKTQANLWTVARDTGRQMSTGLYQNAQAVVYGQAQLAKWGIPGTVTVSQTNDTVTVNILVPVASVTPFRIVNAFTDGNITAFVSQSKEPN